ncbi:IclR family transcriptional regulator [Pseudogracilibacillus sp. SO30301A]|uniref:IclR family transcriptional regulator n=1 Tax=Pseudogracilibacillus sp. SO30301A TaxID=3098291 RepID=UPI00300E08EC
MSKTTTNQTVIQSLQTGIELIDQIVQEARPLKFTDIENITSMTKSNLHKYLNTLTMKGILFRDEAGTYYLGSKLIEFGNAAIGSVNLIDISAPYLKTISKKVNLTTLLSVWTNSGPVIGNIWSTHVGINIGADIGTRLPLLSSAGKVYLAFGDATMIEEWHKKELASLHTQQKTDLEKEIETIRKTRFAYATEPIVEHISSFSIPILNFDKKIIGCVTLVGFNTQIPTRPDDVVSKIAKEEVEKISQIFGYHA